MTILVPYRDRLHHLQKFIPHMRSYLPDADIVIVEQAVGKPFNRGKLINVGFLETKNDFFVAHDIDMIPINVDYSPKAGVTQLAGSRIQFKDYLGGITMFEAETFRKVGGYHNDYFHRAEDNELRFNLHRLNIPVLENHGKFKALPHIRKAPEFIAALWQKAQERRQIQDQLSICEYEVLSREQGEGHLHIKVSI